MSRDSHLHAILALTVCAGLANSATAQCLDALSQPRSHLVATAVADVALFAGGTWISASDVVDLYDASSDTWSSARLSQERFELAATSLGSRAFFAGGGQPNIVFQFQATTAVDVYEATSRSWSVEHLSQARWQLAATSAGGLAVFAGGLRSGTPPQLPSAVVDILDPATATWSVAALSQARGGLAAASVGDLALFAGGIVSDVTGSGTSLFFATVDILDTATGTWQVASLSQPRADLAAVRVGDLILFAGGLAADGVSDVVDLYDGSTGLWSTASLSVARAGVVAFSLGDLAVFAGGRIGLDGSDVVDVYDSATGRWFTTQLAEARMEAAAAVVGDQALIAGGRAVSNQALTTHHSVERFAGGLGISIADGSSGCPCGNDGAVGTGCANSNGSGASLGLGCSAPPASLGQLEAQGLVPGQLALLFSGSAGASPIPFGDGLLGLRAPYQRLAQKPADGAGVASWSLAELPPGALHYLQVWYRDPLSPCGTGVGLTNALLVLLGE